MSAKAKPNLNAGFDDLPIVLEAISARDKILANHQKSATKILDRIISRPSWPKAKDATKIFALNLRGSLLQLMEKPEQAIADFTQVREIDPDNVVALEHMADMDRVASRWQDAKTKLDRLIEVDCRANEWRYTTRAAVFSALRMYQEALEDCRAALEINPSSKVALERVCTVSMVLQDYSKALESAEQILKLDPGSPAGFFQRGKAYACLGRHKEAIEDYTKTIEGPVAQKATIYALRGTAYADMGEIDLALADCERAIADLPENAFVWTCKGTVQRKACKWDDAVESFKSALSRAKDSSTKSASLVSLSSVYAFKGDAEQALTYCDLALAENANSPVAHNNKAWVYAHQGKTADALTEIEAAFSMPPVSSNTRATRGLIYFLLGRKQEAKEDFDECLSKDPKIGEALFFRSVLLKEEGDLTGAERDFAEAKRLKFTMPPFSVIPN